MKKNIVFSIIILSFGHLIHGQSFSKFPVLSSKQKLIHELQSVPNFCAHEHWGSIQAIGGYMPEYNGFYGDVFAGARPKNVTILDIIAEPYLMGWMYNSGYDLWAETLKAGFKTPNEWWMSNPAGVVEYFKKMTEFYALNGTFQCTIKGFQSLYGITLSDFKLSDWKRADSMIRENYASIFEWYTRAMNKAHFTEMIRPVHPEFYLLKESDNSAKAELSFTHTIMRIDPFLEMWKPVSKRRDNLARIANIEPVDAESWRLFLKFYFDLAAKNNTVGIKQLQAYSRDLNFEPRNDKDVKFRGDLNSQEISVFQDWVMHECCRMANEREWTHQIHVGTHNMPASNPLPLERMAERYPSMKIVMLHCLHYFNESAYLAKSKSNIYIDCCWLPILSPFFFSQALDTYLNYVPSNKIMLSHDATTIEMAVGSSLFTREILADKLLEQQNILKLSNSQVKKIALDMLHNNAVRIYKIGDIVIQ